ncbi:MAG: hypothetical protein NTZ83_03650 [Candidatus Pacearchaeota archaeon]|nr:hypothetical protein [Candidatus Pacearchaeota archaeon]
MRCKNLFILVLSVFLFGTVSADILFSENGSTITTQYEEQDYLQADLNVSFFDESLNSTFSDSFGHSIQLWDLLYKNADYYYIFSDLSNTTISSAYQLLELGKANFEIAGAVGNLTYQLKFKGENVFNRTFQIMSSDNLIERELNLKKFQLNATKAEIAKYDFFAQKILSEYLNISSAEANLNTLETQYETAGTGEYTEILNNLSNIKIPSGISETINTNSIVFYPSQESINLNALIEVGGGEYPSNEEKYINAVYAWDDENLKTGLTFREIAVNYNTTGQIILRIFQFEFDKSSLSEDAYFIVSKMENMKFEEPVSGIGETSSGYLYINIRDISDRIIFSTTQGVSFLDVPAFVSPPIGKLHPSIIPPYEQWKDNKKAKWILFTIIAFILLLIGVITYVLLQTWYRRKYESHLFKNRNNLYNIMNYIQNGKKKGMPREEILKNLKKAGWTGEQINYAMRKYEGKKIIGIVHPPLNMPPKVENVQSSKPVFKTFNVKPSNTNPSAKPGQPTAKPVQPQPAQTNKDAKPLFKTFNVSGPSNTNPSVKKPEAEKNPEKKPGQDSNTKV